MSSDSTQKKRTTLSGNSRKRRANPMNLPDLKHSFDNLRKASSEIIRGTKDTKQKIRKFQSAWKALFHRPVEAMAAEAYLRVMERGHKPRHGRTRKAQKGGAALSGAPLDFQTRPGVDGVHGSFPQYLTGGLSFYNTINQEGMFKGCGIQDITPSVPADLGSNKAQGGGGVLSDVYSHMISTPINPTVPPSFLQDAQTAWQGRPLGASPQPSQNQLRYI